MQIEVNNLIIIAVVLMITALFFMIRRKIKIFILITVLALLCTGKAISLEIAIQKAKEIAQDAEELIKKGKDELDISIDAESVIEGVGDAIKEALPNDLYYIDENKKGFGLDNLDNNNNASDVKNALKNIIGDTNK